MLFIADSQASPCSGQFGFVGPFGGANANAVSPLVSVGREVLVCLVVHCIGDLADSVVNFFVLFGFRLLHVSRGLGFHRKS